MEPEPDRRTAAAAGVERVDKEALLRRSDVLSVHMVLSPRSRGLVGAQRHRPDEADGDPRQHVARADLSTPTRSSRRSKAGRLGYAAFDVYDQRAAAGRSPAAATPNVLLTPHIGYVTEENYRSSYPQIVENIVAFLDGHPVRVIQG